ncbi:hypothetical protein EVAR_87403_1 [Eumeta japonica]|uniref:Uncharacterized protein n=1 Tax=Eumeta variegata TaxID=151549 RepID=A0A4C1XGG3_EUMVA|nr:hypothetical protein EVAR_87403_1 [Eumeta japonica]
MLSWHSSQHETSGEGERPKPLGMKAIGRGRVRSARGRDKSLSEATVAAGLPGLKGGRPLTPVTDKTCRRRCM